MKNICIKQLIIIMTVMLLSIQLRAESAINESFLKNINSDGDETSCAISGDSGYFIFARKVKGDTNSDLYFTEFKNKKWTEAKPAAVLNSGSDEISPYISADGKFLLFSSNRPGSLKRMSADKPSYDIYFSEKNGDEWSKPELLFGAVNTADDEINPFITKDGTTLYFTRSPSNDSSRTTIVRVSITNDSWEDVRTAGVSKNSTVRIYMYKKSAFRAGSLVSGFMKDNPGNRDIFFIDDSDGETRELTGIKDPVNSGGDEISITELSDDSVIIASNTNGTDGSYDFIIRRTGKEILKTAPEQFTLKINSAEYKKTDGIKLKILYFNSLKKNSWPVRFETGNPDPAGIINIKADSDIKRVLVIPAESGVKTFAVEFFTGKGNINTAEIKIEPSIETEFTLQYIYFNFNSSEIRLNHIPYIHSLIEYLRSNGSALLILEGYSDGIGSYKANIDISLRRAERVKDYLVKSGINKDRIQTRGSGYRKEKRSDTTQYNRRVESTIIDQ
jgi:outer membrane protein OmpA-like peptidoglycan-associated protein